MKVYIVTRYTWYARDEYEIDSIYINKSDAMKREKEIEKHCRDIEEYEVIE